MISSARQVAAHVLFRVEKDSAFAVAVLDAEIRDAKLDTRDSALATEVVYGTLRVLPRIDEVLGQHVKRAPEPFVHAVLRTAAYQLLHLGRVPPHAVVNDSVALVQKHRERKLGGFVNAVLRKVAAERPESPEPPTMLETPAWFQSMLLADLGQERATEFLRARRLPPPIGLRAEHGHREGLLARVQAAHPEAEVSLGAVSPAAVLARRVGNPTDLQGYASGDFTVQEEGAQVAGMLADAQPGERVLDACAGRGTKSTLLARQVGPSGSVTAVDVHEFRMAGIAKQFKRLGLTASLTTETIDLTVGSADLPSDFDRVVVDAPCTGWGTVHRRPEILLRARPDLVHEMQAIQSNILARALGLVRPGGTVVYIVCSPSRQEASGVAERCDLGNFEPVLHWPLGPAPDGDGVVRIGPWLAPDGPDVYQVLGWRRK